MYSHTYMQNGTSQHVVHVWVTVHTWCIQTQTCRRVPVNMLSLCELWFILDVFRHKHAGGYRSTCCLCVSYSSYLMYSDTNMQKGNSQHVCVLTLTNDMYITFHVWTLFVKFDKYLIILILHISCLSTSHLMKTDIYRPMNNLDTNDNGSIPVRVQEYKSKVDAPYMSSHMMGCNDSQLQYDCTIILFEPS